MDPNLLKTILPVVAIVLVFALRFRSMSKVRPLNPNTLWIVPLLLILHDPATGQLTQRASPAAMILLVAIIGLRYALRSYFDATPGADGKMSEQALVITDALLLFAVGLVGMTRIEMMIRARRILGNGTAADVAA